MTTSPSAPSRTHTTKGTGGPPATEGICPQAHAQSPRNLASQKEAHPIPNPLPPVTELGFEPAWTGRWQVRPAQKNQWHY